MSLFKNLGVDFSEMTVLLVEDNEFERNLAKAALNELGFETVVVARDGEEALDDLERFTSINLVVSDWNMPAINGLEFLKLVHGRWPGIPFVMLTGNQTVEQVADAKNAGVFAYVLKPFTLDNLRKKIVVAVRRRIAMGDMLRDRAGDEIYIQSLEHVEEITDSVGDDDSLMIPAEIQRLEEAVEAALFSSENEEYHLEDLNAATKEIINNAGLTLDAQEIIRAIAEDLAKFLDSIKIPNALQTEVVKLHVESIFAITSGKTIVAGMLENSGLIDGLRKATMRALA